MTGIATLLPMLPDVQGARVVLDVPDTQLESALRRAGARSVEDWAATGVGGDRGTADLILLRGPGAALHAGRAGELLAPGGTLALFVPHRSLGRRHDGALGVEQGELLLRCAGLVPHTAYGVRPDLIAPGFTVPLRPVDALPHFATDLHRPWSTAATLAGPLLTHLPHGREALLPVLLLRATAPQTGTSTRPPRLSFTDRLLADARRHLPGADADALAALQISGHGGHRSYLLYSHRSPYPLAVAKVAATDAMATALSAEQQSLERVRALPSRGEWTQQTVPEPLACWRIGTTTVLLETCLPGQQLTAKVRRRVRVGVHHAREDLALPLAWLSDLQHSSAHGTAFLLDPDLVARAAMHRPYGVPVGQWEAFAAAAAESARERAGLPVPAVLSHGDLWPGNLLVGGPAGLAVLDWEASRPDGSPVSDLLFLLLTYLQLAETRGTTPPSLGTVLARHLLTGATGASGTAYRLFTEHLERLGLPAGAGPALLAHELGSRDLSGGGWRPRAHAERSST